MDIFITSRVDDWIDFEDEIASICEFVLRAEEAPDDCEVSIALVDEAEIASLNQQYRDKPSSTDVLSFPLDDPWDEGFVGEVRAIGDIVIAPEVARRNADERGESFEGELRLLTVHGTLHLLGYDHVDEEDAEEMEERERELLGEWSGEATR